MCVPACKIPYPHPPPTPLHCQLRSAPAEHVLVGATCQLGQHGLNCRTKAVPIETAGALDIEPASNMWSTVSRTARTLVRAQISLSCSPWRARGQHGAPAIAGVRYCLGACARAASRTCSPQCAASSLVAPKTWLPRRASRSRRPSMRRPIGKLRPSRCRPATQLRRQQLVQNSPARPTRHGLEAQKPRRWIIIIIRGERVVGFPFHPPHATSLRPRWRLTRSPKLGLPESPPS